MNTLALTSLTILLSAATGSLATLALTPSPAPSSSPSDLAQLREQLDQLQQDLQQLRAAPTPSQPPPRVDPASLSNRLAIGQIEAEVERLFRERWEAVMNAELSLGTEADTSDGTPLRSAADYLALLLEAGFDGEGGQALWDEAREAGHLDELVALFEARAEERSNDPGAQVDVGHAYLQKIFEVGDGPAAGRWAGKADGSFDRALELDEEHWQARSSKAIALSFWPPIFGKQKEAISNFEVLVQQQEAGVLQDNYSQTYLLLGNLYHQTGQGEKAAAIWRQGLVLFPGDEALSEQLGDD